MIVYLDVVALADVLALLRVVFRIVSIRNYVDRWHHLRLRSGTRSGSTGGPCRSRSCSRSGRGGTGGRRRSCCSMRAATTTINAKRPAEKKSTESGAQHELGKHDQRNMEKWT